VDEIISHHFYLATFVVLKMYMGAKKNIQVPLQHTFLNSPSAIVKFKFLVALVLTWSFWLVVI